MAVTNPSINSWKSYHRNYKINAIKVTKTTFSNHEIVFSTAIANT